MQTLSGAYQDLIEQARSLSRIDTLITENNVYQEAVSEVLPLLDKMIDGFILPGSRISGMEHLKDLYEKSKAGKSCLLLLEHYSNMDLPQFSYLVRKEGELGRDIASQVVAIAGRKLNEDSATVSAFAAAYTRIVIYPSRALIDLDAEKDRQELIRSNAINRAAMKTLNKIKYEGKMILVFPAGTRFRPWEPSSKRGVREIDSYIKSFDYMCPVGISGELLHIRRDEAGNVVDMMDDYISEDVLHYAAGPVLACGEFREKIKQEALVNGAEDIKQTVVDGIMKTLGDMHQIAEAERQKVMTGKH